MYSKHELKSVYQKPSKPETCIWSFKKCKFIYKTSTHKA